MSFLGKIFKKKARSFLGVDLGAGGIKVVELGLKDKKPKLLTYGYTEVYPSFEGGSEDYLENPKISDLLAQVCKKAKVISRDAVASLALNKVTTSIVSISAATEAELKLAVEVEASKLIDYPIKEAVLDFKVLKEETKETIKGVPVKQKTKKVLITVTRQDLIKKYVDIFKKAGLTLKTLETEAFALSRSLVGKDKTSLAIIDIGKQRTNVVIVDSSIPILSRSIGVGGINVSETISRILGLSLKEAEEAKKDISNLPGWDANILPQPIKELFLPIVSEARYLFDLFNKDENKSIEKIILTGGSSFFPGLAAYFSTELGVKAFVGDPFARIIYHEDLKSVLENIGPRLAVAAGLAMREIE